MLSAPTAFRRNILAALPATAAELSQKTGESRGDVLGVLTILLHERLVEFNHGRSRWERLQIMQRAGDDIENLERRYEAMRGVLDRKAALMPREQR